MVFIGAVVVLKAEKQIEALLIEQTPYILALVCVPASLPSPQAPDRTPAGELSPDGCHRWAFPSELPAPAQCVCSAGSEARPLHEMHVVTGNKRRAPIPTNSQSSSELALRFRGVGRGSSERGKGT